MPFPRRGKQSLNKIDLEAVGISSFFTVDCVILDLDVTIGELITVIAFPRPTQLKLLSSNNTFLTKPSNEN